MTGYSLQSQTESIKLLSRVFGEAREHDNAVGISAKLEVCEDVCFGAANWLDLGEISPHPGLTEQGDDKYSPIERALKLGSYDWKLPEFKELSSKTVELILSNSESKKDQKEKLREKVEPKVERAIEAVSSVAIRSGLSHPVFDAASLANMPFKRPTTVIADTSSVLHGGLDFVVRFLYPMARIRIPAVVHMEILNLCDRYFTQRRSKNPNKGSALLNHVNSQGGQRVLLRLELQTDAEIERPRVGADPLRGIFYPDTDPEDRSLGLQVVQKSFADRLILETAIQHRERTSPDHPVILLTSDQGLSRMTLGEGMQSLFFNKDYCLDLFGNVLSATCFYPFIGSNVSDRLYFVPITELLWELAVTFGNSRLRNSNTQAIFEISALGEGRTWNPYHAQDDLLWVTCDNIELSDEERDRYFLGYEARQEQPVTVEKTTKKEDKVKKPIVARLPLKGSYKFSIPSMITLIQVFQEKSRMTDDEGMEAVGVKTLKRYVEFRNFLRSGGFIEKAETGFVKTERLDKLWEALIRRDCDLILESLRNVVSFQQFLDKLKIGTASNSDDIEYVSKNAFPTYCALAEVSCAGLHIQGEGIYPTPLTATIEEFSKLALQAYKKLAKGEEYVLTGQWLEALVRETGTHPIIARNQLSEARQAGFLERFTEGSTPETQYESHTMYYLAIEKAMPVIRKINLYHGDFLIPDRTSVSIRIEGRNS